MNEELRCYTWTLYQLSPIQQGIQAGHAAVELGMKAYRSQIRNVDSLPFQLYHEWASNWKTMVLLNGGDLRELRELISFLASLENRYPWSIFFESEESLGGIPTSVAMILPDRIYLTAENMRKMKTDETISKFAFTEWEYELIERLSKSSLAR